MLTEAIRMRVEKLRKEIEYHRNCYYVLDQPEIADAPYDRLVEELKKLEETYPELCSPKPASLKEEQERRIKEMNPHQEKSGLLLGFLSLYETSNHDGYLGAILVTDLQGIPQEFRCTHPVKPTTLQKPLYGDTLESYIGVNLCGIPLIESIQNKPSLVVVNKDFLLGVRSGSPGPTVFIRRAGEAIEIKTIGGSESKSKRERIDCSSGRFQPVVIIPHYEYADDINSAKEILERVFTYLDPIEPFERMAKAIEVLGKQDKRFQ